MYYLASFDSNHCAEFETLEDRLCLSAAAHTVAPASTSGGAAVTVNLKHAKHTAKKSTPQFVVTDPTSSPPVTGPVRNPSVPSTPAPVNKGNGGLPTPVVTPGGGSGTIGEGELPIGGAGGVGTPVITPGGGSGVVVPGSQLPI